MFLKKGRTDRGQKRRKGHIRSMHLFTPFRREQSFKGKLQKKHKKKELKRRETKIPSKKTWKNSKRTKLVKGSAGN